MDHPVAVAAPAPAPMYRGGNPWSAIGSRLLTTLRHSPAALTGIIREASTLALALAVLGVCASIVTIIYVLIFVLRPRLFSIGHSEAFEDYMSTTSREISATIIRLSSSLASKAASAVFDMDQAELALASSCGGGDGDPDPETETESLRVIADRVVAHIGHLASRPSLEADIIRRFEYHRSLASMSSPSTPNFLARLDLKSDQYFTSDVTGNVDSEKVAAYYLNVFTHLEHLRGDVTLLSKRLHALCGLHSVPGYSSDSASAILDVHLLRLHLDTYHDSTSMSYETRKSGPGRIPTAIMTLYWWPTVETTFVKAIPALWTTAPKKFVDELAAYERLWEGLGVFISKLPCYMAHMDADKRKSTCDGGDTFASPSKRVIEGFSIGGLIKGIMSLILNLAPMIATLADILTQLVTDPFGALISIVMLLLGLVIGIIMLLIYFLLTVTQIFWLPGISYAFFLSFGLAGILTVLDVLGTALVAIPYILLTFVDLLTSGAVMHLLRCESLPSDWAVQPLTAFNNVRARMGFLCAAPCGGTFSPSFGGIMCSCTSVDVPPFCPQQQLFRAFRSLPLGDPVIFDGFTPDAEFYRMDPDQQQRKMAEAYNRKANFIGRCFSATNPYTFFTRHMCTNLDHFLPDNPDLPRLKAMCRQTYCDFAPAPGDSPDDVAYAPDAQMLLTPPSRLGFCSNSDVTALLDQQPSSGRLGGTIMLVALAAFLLLVIIYAIIG